MSRKEDQPISELSQSRMTNLVIVRHGEYDEDNRLSEYGKKQIEELVKKIKEGVDLNGKSALVLSSTAPRALDSANILVQALECKLETHDLLWSGGDSPRYASAREAHELIESAKARADFIIVVTHLEHSEGLPPLLSEKDFGERQYVGSLKKGQGLILDYTQKSMRML